jgi:glycosyltransferase involved in cell wall biosynthesis
MRIVIDMQGAQTASRFRGIGRYTMAFAQAVVRNRGEHEIILALSGLFPGTIESIRAAFVGLLPQENIRVWHAPGPVNEEQPSNETRREVAELLREAFLASLQPDVIHISSLFEGYVDDAVTSVGRFDRATPVSVILYDLIPLLNPDHYLKPNPRYEQYYLRKIEFLRQAGLHLAISDFARQEAIDTLGTPNGKTVAISTGLDNRFYPQVIDDETARQFQASFNITRAFVLYTGGTDERKNLSRLIDAYTGLPPSLREAYQLVFAGHLSEDIESRARTGGLKNDELVLTGYVSDEDLVQLYNLCQLYVFPFLARGLRPAGAGGHGLWRTGDRCQHRQPSGSDRPRRGAVRSVRRQGHHCEIGKGTAGRSLPPAPSRARTSAGKEVFLGQDGHAGHCGVGGATKPSGAANLSIWPNHWLMTGCSPPSPSRLLTPANLSWSPCRIASRKTKARA